MVSRSGKGVAKIMRNNYKNISFGSIEEVADWARDVNRNRLFDVRDFRDLAATSSSILPVPTSSSDISGAEKAGDIAVDDSYLYYVAESGGSLVWRRISGSSF